MIAIGRRHAQRCRKFDAKKVDSSLDRKKKEGAGGAQELSHDGHCSTQVTDTTKGTQLVAEAHSTAPPLNAIVTGR
jgi:hypothetical protein